VGERLRMGSRCLAFPIKQAVPVRLGLAFVCIWQRFWWGKNIFTANYTNETLFHILYGKWGVGRGGCRWAALDVMFYK